MSKIRLDLLMVENGLALTREKAKRLIMAGVVFSGTQRMDKPGVKVPDDTHLTVKGTGIPHVSRAGLKMKKALTAFNLDISDKIMVDIGSSTGGFTDCALQNGARMSYAIDAGYNQLAWSLRQDDRVAVMERTNFRYVTPDLFEGNDPNFAAVDVSFISLRLILPTLKTILRPDSDIVVLVKPQFEAGKDQVGKKGIVRDKHVHYDVLSRIIHFANDEGYQFGGLVHSGITGGSGNIEFLIHFRWLKHQPSLFSDNAYIRQRVEEAHHYFHGQG